MMISFLLFIAGAFVIFFMARFQNQKLLAEDKQYEEVKNEISFEHCKHIPMEEKFNTELCHDRSRELAFAWRYYKNNSTDDDTCFDIFEQVDCHTYLIQNNSLQNYTRSQKFLMCQGLFNVSVNDTKETNVVWVSFFYFLGGV
uniref:Uncharacterized protein n=1 Tax=Panagrolaimus davidi TaxID=227884 RepID=A0A914Q0T9_9BILA